MNEAENIVRASIPSLLLTREWKAKTSGIDGGWTLNGIHRISATLRNIEFNLSFVNGTACLLVSGKINRATNRLSKIGVEDV